MDSNSVQSFRKKGIHVRFWCCKEDMVTEGKEDGRGGGGGTRPRY